MMYHSCLASLEITADPRCRFRYAASKSRPARCGGSGESPRSMRAEARSAWGGCAGGFRRGRSNGGSWCRRASDRKRWTRRRSGSSRDRRRTMSWSTSRSSTSRTGRSPSWRRSPGSGWSSEDGRTGPCWRSWSSWRWCTNSCTALGRTSPRPPDSRGPRSGEASTDSGLDQGQRHGEQARLRKTERRPSTSNGKIDRSAWHAITKFNKTPFYRQHIVYESFKILSRMSCSFYSRLSISKWKIIGPRKEMILIEIHVKKIIHIE